MRRKRTLARTVLLIWLVGDLFFVAMPATDAWSQADLSGARPIRSSPSPATSLINGIPYASIHDLALRFNASVLWRPETKDLVVTYEGRSARFLAGSSRAMVGDRFFSLTAPVVLQDERILAPLPSLTGVLNYLVHGDVSPGMPEVKDDEIEELPILPGEQVEDVDYLSYPRYTRLIIALSGKTAYQIGRRTPQTILVTFPKANLSGGRRVLDVEDGVISQVAATQDDRGTSILIHLASNNLEFQDFSLSNPDRLAVDVYKARGGTADVLTDIFAPGFEPGDSRESLIPPSGDHLLEITTVVLDPGHGGRDTGSQGRDGLREKDVTLDVAFRLKTVIEERLKMRVVLTRSGDYFVPLKERTTIANHAKDGSPADLLISIHTNSNPSEIATGFETYYAADLRVPGATIAPTLKEVSQAPYGPGRPKVTLWDVQYAAFLRESTLFAALVQRELAEELKVESRGVKQAPFIVLNGAAMPSVLLEIGFISNRVEEARLRSSYFKEKCVDAICRSIAAFRDRFGGTSEIPATEASY